MNEQPATPDFSSVAAMLEALRPPGPVYCIRPQRYLDNTRAFIEGFPGRVLYAVKVNDDPRVVRLIHQAGVRDFDCASVAEVALVTGNCPDARAFFMVPVWPRGDAGEVYRRYGVRHFVIDHEDGLARLQREIEMPGCVVFVRMAYTHASALNNLSAKFGALPEHCAGLLSRVRETGAEPALAFNVGSAVTDPQAYAMALGVARGVLNSLTFRVRLLDIGGGFPFSYPGFEVPALSRYFDTVRASTHELPLAPGGEILTEPGRALAAPGLSAVVEVLQRKDERLYLNDGAYGIFWELRFDGHDRFPVRAWRNAQPLQGETREFTLFGPTCDAFDRLRGRVPLPVDIAEGDYLEFDHIGAYSLAGRTRFNGHYSENIVTISDQ